MNKRCVFSFCLLGAMALGSTAMADNTAPTAATKQVEPRDRGYGKFRLGFGFDFGGAPNPLNLELTLNPFEDMLTIHGGLSYNVLSFGPTIGLQVDPLAYFSRLPIGLIGDVSGGFIPRGTPPGVNTGIQMGYNYASLMGGIRLGRPTGFHWNFLAGTSWTHITTSGFANAASPPPGVSIGEPSVALQVTPTFLTGFAVNFTL